MFGLLLLEEIADPFAHTLDRIGGSFSDIPAAIQYPFAQRTCGICHRLYRTLGDLL